MGKQTPAYMKDIFPPGAPSRVVSLFSHCRTLFTTTDFFSRCPSGVAVSDTARADGRLQVSFKYTSRHHELYAAQVLHGTTYVVLTLSLLVPHGTTYVVLTCHY